MPDWELSVEAYGSFIFDFCDALGVEQCTIVGNSMGGFIAADTTVREPSRFEKLVLVSAAGISHARMRRQPVEVAARVGIATAPLTLRIFDRGLRRPGIRRALFSLSIPEPASTELPWSAGTDRHPDAAGGSRPDRLRHPRSPGGRRGPHADRLGPQRHVVPPSDAVGHGRRLRNSRTVIFDKTGHLPMAERPVRFNRVLETFLAEE
jgi:pimeloyl-ACP methyl ester carboxylesterase